MSTDQQNSSTAKADETVEITAKTEVKALQARISELEQLVAEQAEKLASKKSSAKRDFVMTPYQATKKLNEIREAAGLKAVNSPMLYQYARKNAFVTVEVDDGTGRKAIDEASFLEWAEKHTAAQLAK